MMNLDGKLKKICKEEYAVLSIFGLGLLIRLIGSTQVGLAFDEHIWLKVAKQISFSPQNLNLVLHGAFHPPFEAYLIKLSTILFANNLPDFLPSYRAMRLSTRLLHVVLCSGTILIIYYLVKDGLGKSTAIFAAFLIAFSQFHVHFSRTVIQTAPLLFFVSLSLLFFWKALKQNNNKFIILTGLSIGLGYLCEETASLLLVIFFIFLIICKTCIQWLKKWETYVALLAFLLIISPDLYWNVTTQRSDIAFHLTRAANFQGISLLPTTLLIGELFLATAKDLESFVGGFGRHARWAIEYPPMHWVLGVLALLAIPLSIIKRQNDFIKLMLTTFFVIFLFFTFFASSGPFGNLNFWWASIIFLPAIVLVSYLFSALFQKSRPLKCLPLAFILYFFLHSVSFLAIRENIYVRRPSFLAKYYINSGRNHLLRGDIPSAANNFHTALTHEPKSVTALLNLAECYKRTGQTARANSLLKQMEEDGLAISKMRQLLFDAGYLKEWLLSQYYAVPDRNLDPVTNPLFFDPFTSVEASNGWQAPKYQKIVSPSAFVDLKELLRNPPNTVSYAFTKVYSPKEQQANLFVGVDDGVTIWFNREKIYENNDKLWWFPDEDSLTVKLHQGWNELFLRVLYTEGWYYGFTIKLLDISGRALDNVETRAF